MEVTYMAITLNDLAGASNKKEVSITDIPVEQETKKESEDYLSQQFKALDDLIDSTPSPVEENTTESDEELDKVVTENLDNFNPEDDDVPVAPAAEVKKEVESKNDALKAETDIAKNPDNFEMKSKTLSDDEDKKEEKPLTEEETEKEFNHLFDNTSDDEDLDKDLFDEDSDKPEDEDDSDDDMSEEEKKEIIKKYKSELSSIISEKNKINTEGFKVSGKSITMSKLLNVEEPQKKIADWVATTAKKSFSTVEYSGLELQKLNPNNRTDRNGINTVKDIYKTIYNHLVGATKDGFETWLKSTPYRDIENYYFGAFKATFGDLNVVTYQCPDPKCNNIFISEQPLDKMYEVDKDYQDDFNKIYNGDTTLEVDFQEEITPVSEQFAVGIIEPSIYTVEIEPLVITDDMRKSYSRIIGLLPFIKRLYYIDNTNRVYVPIDEQPVANDIAKTVKRKLNIYYKVLGSLSNDQLAVLQAYVYNYRQQASPIKFYNPECTCPKCKKLIPKEETTPMEMLFSRAQSVLVANLSEN